MKAKIESDRRSFAQKKIEKPDFIKKMYSDWHSYLFEYAEAIEPTNVARIEITNNEVIVTTKDRGLHFIAIKNDRRIAPIAMLNFNDYELQETRMVMNLVKDNATVFDIGANVGWYSINLAAANRNAAIHAFEPIPKTFSALQKNVTLNRLNNVTLNNFGLSNHPGEFPFYYYSEGSGNASMANLSERTEIERVNCALSTIDDYSLQNNVSVDFIKCDVEGAELFVFQGGLETIKRDKPIVFSELLRKWAAKFNYQPDEILSFFDEIGYSAFTVLDEKLVLFSSMDETTVETNFFFLHKKNHLCEIRKWT